MLTPEAKKLLADTIRGTAQDPEKGLRARILRGLRDEADRTYRLAVPLEQANLEEAPRKRRARIEAHIDERARAQKPKGDKELKATKERLYAQALKEAAATLLNRLVLLRQLEAHGLSRPQVLTGGWNSKGYREFRAFAPTLCADGTLDPTEGYATLLQLVFDELSVDLPGLFGNVGLSSLFPVPASTLKDVVEHLDAPGLATAWTDDTTLGWVYQYWNDPDREVLDAKIAGGGKIEPHEIASKTQMFTERYMVEWLLQNSLGLTWLAMCKKHGWKADAEALFPDLEARRADWRKKREAGEVALDALMPIAGELEEHWKYYVLQRIPEDAVTSAPESVQAIKLLDPACGSGHFLVIAFDMLAALYREEARHRGVKISAKRIAESILENNLHGVDIDPRATQIAAAALYLKARSLAKDARPRRLNLVAAALEIGHLEETDAALTELRATLWRTCGISAPQLDLLVKSLADLDHIGSLLRIDVAVDEAILGTRLAEEPGTQRRMFDSLPLTSVSFVSPRSEIVDKLEAFLSHHSTSDDLGVRLDGENVRAGARFIELLREEQYDLVVGNPPYQGLAKTRGFEYVAKTYPMGKADLYAAFLERSIQLSKPGGLSALLTMRGWMFLGQFAALRANLLEKSDLRSIGDFDRGAFDEVPNEVLAVCVPIFRKASPTGITSVACQPTALDDRSYDRQRTNRKRAALLAQVGRHEFDPRGFKVIEAEPIVYWWDNEFLKAYGTSQKLGTTSPVRTGLCTSNNTRFLRKHWELHFKDAGSDPLSSRWAWFITGAKGISWFDQSTETCLWSSFGLEVKTYNAHLYGSYSRTVQNEAYYFRRGIAYTPIGSTFSARVFRRVSVMGKMGSSVFPEDLPSTLCSMNTSRASFVLQSLNPGLHFEVGDVNKLPIVAVESSSSIFDVTERAFGEGEAHRETSVEFREPGKSAWSYAQAWAQSAVDRAHGAPLPPYKPVYEEPAPEAHVSFALGVSLGRFGAHGEGIIDTPPDTALPAGLLFLSADSPQALEANSACAPLVAAWNEHGAAVGQGDDRGTYLRKSFFDYHKKLYENRPIYLPLSSSKKSFVAYASIHRWSADTLNVLLADHLVPLKRRLDGELADIREARVGAAAVTAKNKVEKRFGEVQKLVEELADFIAKVTQIAEHGAPPPDDKTPKREADAPYVMDLDDGVMVNSASLWTLLEPQWKEPKKWWKELCSAQGKKDYDWAHLAARYFPSRVRAKCHEDPSLGVAHKCFWELHPAKAYAWELRLQDEIAPTFTIDEPGSNAAREAFLRDHAEQAAEIHAKELKRREKKAAKGASEEEDPQTDLPGVDEEGEADE